jgi:AAA family ATP:ADP antiporter
VARLGRRRFIPLAYRFFGLNLLAFFVLLETVPAGSQLWVGRVFFVWTSVFNLFVVSVFWSFMADLFRAEQGRRLFGFIAVGATLGGVAGSAITSMLVEHLGTAPLLVVSAAALEAALVCVRALLRGAAASQPEGLQPERPIGGSALAGIRSVARSPYLLAICGYMLLYTVTSTFLYFQQAEIVPAALGGDRAARTAYLARIDLAVNLSTVIVQTTLAGRIVQRIGVAAALAVLPAATAAGFLGLAAAPGLGVLAVSGAAVTANYAIARPCREVLYTVLAREDKYKAKHFIDTFVYRAGDQAGAWSYAAARGLGLAVTGIPVAAEPLSVMWGAVALWLGRRQRRLEQAGWRSPNEG